MFRLINVPGAEAENEPLTWSDLAVWTPEFLNFMCWKYDSDRLDSFWDIASQSQKSGHVYSAKYGTTHGYGVMGLGAFDGGEDYEHNGVGLVELSTISAFAESNLGMLPFYKLVN